MFMLFMLFMLLAAKAAAAAFYKKGLPGQKGSFVQPYPRSRATATSLTLVPVGPVTINPSTRSRAW